MKRLMVILVVWAGLNPALANQGLPEEAQAVLAETSIEPAVAPMESQTQEAPGEASAVVEALPESEIPLNLGAKKAVAGEESPIFRLLAGVAVLGLMGVGAFVWIRRNSKPGQRQNAPQIKVLTQHWLGPKKSLAIVRVSGESILIGITDQNISMLKSLSLLDDEVPVETPERFDRVMATEDAEALRAEEGEEFAMSGLSQVKESVSRRLKGMRSFQ